MAALARRYVVMALATEAPFDPGDPDGAFVLKPWKDPAALRAPTVRGDVGRRNEPHLQASASARPVRSARKASRPARTRPAKKLRR